MKKRSNSGDKKNVLVVVSVVFNVLAIAVLVLVLVIWLNHRETANEVDYVQCVDAVVDVERPGFEIPSALSGRVFVTSLGEVYIWPKQNISGLGAKVGRVLTKELVGSLGGEIKFDGYKVNVKDVLNAIQMSYGSGYNGDNVIMVHSDGT